MFPSLKQYSNWSLPSKYGFWGIIISLATVAWPIIAWVMSVPENSIIAFNYGSSEMTIYGGPGNTPDEPVIIRGAKSHEAGIKAEYYWIKRRYLGYRPVGQTLFQHEEPAPKQSSAIITDAETGRVVEFKLPEKLPPRKYDVIYLKSWYGKGAEVYFDVTPYIGKGDELRAKGPTFDEALKDAIQGLKR